MEVQATATTNRFNMDDILIGLSIFVSCHVFFKVPFEGYFHYLIFILYLPFFIYRYGFQKLPFQFILLPAITSLINLFLGNCDVAGFLKIFIGMLLTITFYNYVFIHYNYDFKKLFRIYLRGIIICCYYGLFEAFSYNIGFTPGYSLNWIFNKWGYHLGGFVGIRINSFFSEPSQFALVLLPALFISMQHLIARTYTLLTYRESLLVCLLMILTTSSSGFIGIFLSFILIGINIGKGFNIFLTLCASFLVFIALYVYVPDFKSRFDSFNNLTVKKSFTIDDVNTSSFVLYNNFHVATENLKEHPFFGSGLGSYSLAYSKFSFTKADDFMIKKGFDFNSQDGNSLFIRTMAEMGLIGILFWIFFIPKCFIRKKLEDPNNINWLYSSAVLLFIFGYLVRQGNYFINGFPFFFLFYYFLKVKDKLDIGVYIEEEEKEKEYLT